MFRKLIATTTTLVNFYFVLLLLPPKDVLSPYLAVNLIGCDRATQFDLALYSLAKATQRGNYKDKVIVYASVDCLDDATINTVKYWEEHLGHLLNVVYVESYQMHIEETPEQAKKLDERVARHWLSSNNRVFELGYDNVIYLESDHVVSLDFFQSVETLINFTDSYCPKCFMMNMGCHGNCLGKYNPKKSKMNQLAVFPLQNIGAIYRRGTWKKLIKNIHLFCELLGDWDINMNNLLKLGIDDLDPRSIGYVVPRVLHTKTCYTSRRKQFTGDCKHGADEIHRAQYQEFIKNRQRPVGSLIIDERVKKRRGRPGKKIFADDDTKNRCMMSLK